MLLLSSRGWREVGVSRNTGEGEKERGERWGGGEGGEVGRWREDEVWAEDQRAQLGTVSRAGRAHRGVL